MMLAVPGPPAYENCLNNQEAPMPDLFSRHGIRAVLFDFDGTLADSPIDFMAMRKRAAEAVAPLTRHCLRTDRPLMEALEELYAQMDAETAGLARGKAMRAVVDVEIEAARRARLFPFALPLLDALRGRGIATGVVTRNCPEAIFTVCPGLRDHVGCVLTRYDVSHVKPHPQHIGSALSALGCSGSECLMVGDHPMDIEAGKRAGTLTAGVCSGDIPRERLAEARPDWLARDAGQLMLLFGISA